MSSNERRYRPTNYAGYVLPFDATTRNENRQLRDSPPSPDRYNPYYRRRTADNFPVPEPVHITPTIARSSLTASASINDPSMDGKNNLLPIQLYMSTFINSCGYRQTDLATKLASISSHKEVYSYKDSKSCMECNNQRPTC